MTALSATDRTTLRRSKDKGREDRSHLYAVLRAAFICHLGITVDGTPMVVPTVYGFDDDHLYLHGSVASRSLTQPTPTVCVTITVVDGLVLARSLFEHSINYRSAMLYGIPQILADPWDKLDALRIITEHVTPGQWNYARRPSTKELAATTILAIPLAEASVKMRTGPPDDADSPDAALGLWAGELPLRPVWQDPVPDPALPAGIDVPPHIAQRAAPSS